MVIWGPKRCRINQRAYSHVLDRGPWVHKKQQTREALVMHSTCILK